MINLDEYQEATLRESADIIGRAAARRYLHKARRLARFGLTVWSILRPHHFRMWNDARLADRSVR